MDVDGRESEVKWPDFERSLAYSRSDSSEELSTNLDLAALGDAGEPNWGIAEARRSITGREGRMGLSRVLLAPPLLPP